MTEIFLVNCMEIWEPDDALFIFIWYENSNDPIIALDENESEEVRTGE